MRTRKEINAGYNISINFLQMIIKKLCFIFILILVLSQVLFTVEPFNYFLNKTYKLEGKSVNYIYPAIKNGTIELTLENDLKYGSEILVFLNGEVYSKFHKNSIVLSIKEGDIIEVQGKNIENLVRIKIAYVSDNIISPRTNKTFFVSNSIEFISKIKFK